MMDELEMDKLTLIPVDAGIHERQSAKVTLAVRSFDQVADLLFKNGKTKTRISEESVKGIERRALSKLARRSLSLELFRDYYGREPKAV